MKYINIGLQMALTIVAFVLVGWWLDKRYDLSPLLTLIGSFLGIGIGMFNFIREVMRKEEG